MNQASQGGAGPSVAERQHPLGLYSKGQSLSADGDTIEVCRWTKGGSEFTVDETQRFDERVIMDHTPL